MLEQLLYCSPFADGPNSTELQKQFERQAAACLLDQQPGVEGSRCNPALLMAYAPATHE